MLRSCGFANTRLIDKFLNELESEDTLGNFEIQQLMSNYNEAETLAKAVADKAACVADSVIQKI